MKIWMKKKENNFDQEVKERKQKEIQEFHKIMEEEERILEEKKKEKN